MEMNFCRRCGEHLEAKSPSLWKCKNDHSTYLNPLPAAAIFFIDGDKILVSRRAIEPGKGMLDAVGGFIDADESAEEAVKREILEETGLRDGDYDEPVLFCTATTRYMFEDEEKYVLSSFFWSRLKAQAQPVANDDVSELLSVSLDDVGFSEFHGDDVKEVLRQLRHLVKINQVSPRQAG